MKPLLEELVSKAHEGGRERDWLPKELFVWPFAFGLQLLGCVIWPSRDPKGTTSVVFYPTACIFYTGISVSLVFVIPGSAPQRENFFACC